MRRLFRWLLISQAIASWVWADAPNPSIEGPTTVAFGETFTLDARRSISDKPLRWKLEGKPVAPDLVFDQAGKSGILLRMTASAPPGTSYNFTLIAKGVPKGEAELDAEALNWTVIVQGSKPPPDPIPNPTPNPKPDPDPKPPPAPDPTPIVSGKLFLAYIADASALASNDAATQAARLQMVSMKRHPAIEQAKQTYNASYRWFASDEAELLPADPQHPEFVRYNLISYATQTGLPCLIVQDEKGNIVERIKAPQSGEGVVAELKKLRGSK